MMSRMLIGLSIALAIVTVLEVVYLFYDTASGSSKNPTTQSNNDIANNSNPSKPANAIGNPAAINNLSNTVVNPVYIRNFLRYKKGGVLSSIIATLEYKAEIVELNTKTGTASLNGVIGVDYEYGLKIRGRNETDTPIYYNSNDVKKLKVYDMTSGSKVPIKFEGLKEGDTITIKHVLDLSESPATNLIDAEIVKL